MSMIEIINNIIVNQRNGKINSKNIFIIDYKNINGGNVEVLENEPDHNSVHLTNDNKVSVYYVALNDNALKVNAPEGQVKQCECVLFPDVLDGDYWVLFIEMKYAYNKTIAFDEKTDYPNTMIEQIISTVKFFREQGILPNNKKVSAIVSFPNLIAPFSESFFTRSEKTREEILLNYKIRLRATNNGKIISPFRLRI